MMNSSDDTTMNEASSVSASTLYPKMGLKALKAAMKVERRMTKHSRIAADEASEHLVPHFSRDELVLGKLLGTGGFNCVYEVLQIKLSPQEDNNNEPKPESDHTADTIDTSHQNELRREAACHSSSYAIKFLNSKTLVDPDRYCIGSADLVLEAKFLANLDHAHIIKLRGMPMGGTSQIATCQELSYFLLLDKMHTTLNHKLDETWATIKQELDNPPLTLKIWMGGALLKRKRKFTAERLQVALDVAQALEYLHAHRIVYRDLKPENVGFHQDDITVLFDFGLAKELKPGSYTETYHLTGHTGSLRYMAPEVARYLPYNLSADIYSFGILLWHIYSLDMPYEHLSRSAHSHLVVLGGERPPLDDKNWPPAIGNLMKACWEEDPYERPTMVEIVKTLSEQIHELLRDAVDESKSSSFPKQRQRSGSFVLNRDVIAEQASDVKRPSQSLVQKVTQRLPSNRSSSRRGRSDRGRGLTRSMPIIA